MKRRPIALLPAFLLFAGSVTRADGAPAATQPHGRSCPAASPAPSEAPPGDRPQGHRLKGYELYSWQDPRDRWHYALLAATNRLKLPSEILDSAISEAELRSRLSKLPELEDVVWCPPPALKMQPPLENPPAAVVASLVELAQQVNIHLGGCDSPEVAVAPEPRAEPILKIETVDVPWGSTGTYHYVDELRVSAGSSAPLILRSSREGDVLAPIPGPQYPLGHRHVLLLGWSSTGGGAETLHALVLEVAPTGVELRRHVELTRPRSDSVLIVRRLAPTEILLGFLEPAAGPRRSEEDDYSLVLGSDRAEQLSWPEVRKLSYTTIEPHPSDYFYAPPFGSRMEATGSIPLVLVRDGAVGSDPLARLVRPHVAWLKVSPERVAVSAPLD